MMRQYYWEVLVKLSMPRRRMASSKPGRSPESLVKNCNKKLGKLVAPKEVVKIECWVATEGNLGSLHVKHNPL